MSDNRYYQDETIKQGYYEDNGLNAKDLVVASTVILGSVAAYKSGIFKRAIKGVLTDMSERKPAVSEAFNDLRKWLNSDVDVPDKSVFRMGIKGTLKDFYKNTSIDNIKKVFNATRDDLEGYQYRFNKTLERLAKDSDKYVVKNSTHNTELLRDIKRVVESSEEYSDNFANARETLKSKGYSELILNRIQTSENSKKSLDRIGFRNAEIEDLFDIKVDSKGKVHLTAKTKYDFSGNEDLENGSAKKRIEDMLNFSVYGDDGIQSVNGDKSPLRLHQKYNSSTQNFKNMKVDSSLFIDEAGKIIDLRNQKKSAQEFARHFATDWGIPVVGFNPLRMFGVDKLGKEKAFMGSISEKSVAPFLTGVRGNKLENTIENLKDKVDILKGVKENVTIINGNVYRISDDGQGITKMNYKTKKELIFIPKHMDKGASVLTPTENALRKMGGLSTRSFTDYTEEDGWKFYKQKIAKFFDVGYQENTRLKDSFENPSDFSSVDSYIEKIISKVRPKPYKSSENAKNFSNISTPGFDGNAKDSFFVVNSNTTLKDVAFNKFNKESVKSYLYQFGANYDNDFESVNRNTGKLYFMLERMNQSISSVGLGLSLDSTKSSWDTAKNLILKRFLPIYGAYQGYQFINMFGEDDTENGTKPSTIHQRIMSGLAKTDIGLHAITDKIGLDNVTKNLGQLTPGSDMLEELPFITSLNLQDTADDRKEYWEKGYDPVRKGRFWELNETPFVGGKIQYYKPNAYRRAMADAKFSDSLYGSRKEYYSQILNPHYYDKKHYDDRPYLMTSSAFENIPLVGPVASSTIGRIVKPPKKMHEEYWNKEERRPKTLEEIKAEQQMSYMVSLNEISKKNEEKLKTIYTADKLTIGKVFNIGEFKREDYKKQIQAETNRSYETTISPYEPPGKYIGAAYRTPSGALSTVTYDVDLAKQSMYKLNRRGYTPSQLESFNNRMDINSSYMINGPMIKNQDSIDVVSPYSLSNTLKSQYMNNANVAGIYGFIGTGFITGSVGSGDNVIETSGFSRSFNRSVWDQEMGGIGGDISEIFRRFIQKRRNDVDYYNPIRNTMPNWLPGENGFTDFQHGDPYTKVPRGEERLPGEGYERLNNIDMDKLLKFGIGSSFIGKSKDDIVKHLLNQDEITDPEIMDIVKGGTKEHKRIEKEMLDSGLAIDSEVEINDEENNIVGTYDLRIHDKNSKTGEAIMDIKTINEKGFNEVKKNKAPKDVNQRQVNWYLHHTNKDNKGYIMYVNRDNPDETYTVGFDYDKKLYKSTMATVEEARNEVRNLLDQRKISRADLYKPIDKYRILADVAPYSDEFNQMNNMMSNMDLSKEEDEEVKAIRDRVKNVRKQTRFYDYKFKYNDTIKSKTEITGSINNELYTIKGSDSPIKLAGVNIKKDNPNYEDAVKFLRRHLRDGENVSVRIAKDKTQRYNGDMYNSIKATVYSDGLNINKELIKRGYAEEIEDDYTAASIFARFNGLERGFGAVWESVAHFDSLANTKLLQVRTAAEDYERKQVYGKDFKSWEQPFSDFVLPSLWKNMNRGPIWGIVGGATVGYMVGARGNKYGKLLGTAAGAMTVGVAKLFKTGYEATKGERWIPNEKKEEREINDYIDKLKYVKNRRLFEVYSEKALTEDGIDVKKVIASNRVSGSKKKRRAREIQEVKVEAKQSGKVKYKDFEDVGVDIKLIDKLPTFLRGIVTLDLKNAKENKEKSIMKTVNAEINEVSNDRKSFTMSDNALRAIEYYNSSEETMYAYDPGEELANIITAMPKKDRRYFREFLAAPKREHDKILSIAPKYMRRALQNAYGKEVEDKEDLAEYFSEHYLPGEDWDGWQESFNLKAMKVKLVQNQNMDFGSFDIWENDKTEADMYGPIAIPNMTYKTKNTEVVKRKLTNLLGEAGYEDINLSYRFNSNKSSVNINMYENRKDKFENKIKERLGVMY